jgi:hypothetical protein
MWLQPWGPSFESSLCTLTSCQSSSLLQPTYFLYFFIRLLCFLFLVVLLVEIRTLYLGRNSINLIHAPFPLVILEIKSFLMVRLAWKKFSYLCFPCSWDDRHIPLHPVYLCVRVCACVCVCVCVCDSTWACTQGLTLAWQVSHSASLFLCWIFLKYGLTNYVLRLALNCNPPNFCLLSS